MAHKGPGTEVVVTQLEPESLRFEIEVTPQSPQLDVVARDELIQSVENAIRHLMDSLGIDQPLRWQKLLAAVMAVDGVDELPLSSLHIWRESQGVSAEIQPISAAGSVVAFPDLTPPAGSRLILAETDPAFDGESIVVRVRDLAPVYVQVEIMLPGAEPSDALDLQNALQITIAERIQQYNQSPDLIILSHEHILQALQQEFPDVSGLSASAVTIHCQRSLSNISLDLMTGGELELELEVNEFLRSSENGHIMKWSETP